MHLIAFESPARISSGYSKPIALEVRGDERAPQTMWSKVAARAENHHQNSFLMYVSSTRYSNPIKLSESHMTQPQNI
jgi:hypothetical protein